MSGLSDFCRNFWSSLTGAARGSRAVSAGRSARRPGLAVEQLERRDALSCTWYVPVYSSYYNSLRW